MGKTLRQ